MQAFAHCSAATTTRTPRSRSSSGSLGSASGPSSIRTWCTAASEWTSISWRSSATIETAPTCSSSDAARSSISAGVASRPANMPKLTRTSSAGGSCSCTAKASAGLIVTESLVTRNSYGLTFDRFPAETAHRDERAGHAPACDHGDRDGVLPEVVVEDDDVADEPDEVDERERFGDRAEHFRERVRREERAGDERDREVDRVDDGRRSLGAPDDRRQPHAERGERGGAEDQHADERDEVFRDSDVESHPCERDEQDRFEEEDEDDRPEHGGDVRRAREGRRPQPLQDTGLPADDEQEREAGERRRRGAVADHPGEEEEISIRAVDFLATVGGAEDQKEDDRKEKGEERELAAPPEQLLLGPELVQQQPHSPASCVSVR